MAGHAPTQHYHIPLLPLRLTVIIRLMIKRVVLAAVLGLCNVAAAGNTGWPQFLGPTRDGLYGGNDVAGTWAAGGPPVVWRRDVGQGFSGPVVAGGKLILYHRVEEREVVECLNAATGKAIWSEGSPANYVDDFGFDEGPRATPTIAGDKVFTFGALGLLTCRELETGKEVWAVDTAEKFAAPKGFFGMACSPLVDGELVIVIVGGRPDAGVVAFERETGVVRWQASDDEAGYASPVAATVNGKRRVFALTAAGLNVLEPATGKVLAKHPFQAPIRASVNAATPLVIGDRVLLSASYDTGAALLKLRDDDTLQRIWSGDESLSSHYATPVHRGGLIYGFHGRQERGPSLRCVELETGRVRWEQPDFGAGSILLAEDKLLVLTEKGQLVCAPATPDGFKPTARAQVLPFECRAYPALAGGKLYARSKDKLVCVDLRAKARVENP
jgi:outer membrane protein assembly factor BamB